MGIAKAHIQLFFFSPTIGATVSKLEEEMHNDIKELLKINYIIRPHGGAITTHFTFWPVTLEP